MYSLSHKFDIDTALCLVCFIFLVAGLLPVIAHNPMISYCNVQCFMHILSLLRSLHELKQTKSNPGVLKAFAGNSFINCFSSQSSPTHSANPMLQNVKPRTKIPKSFFISTRLSKIIF